MTMRTPLGRVLYHGSAHDGVGHWMVERVTGLALAPLSLWLLVSLLSLPHVDYISASAWVASGWNPVWLSLLVLLSAWHSWLGVQVVVEDYVHGFGAKTGTLLLSTFVHVLLALSGVYAVLRTVFRGVP
ncbi:MAG TPA: succinate dehydrogenase, hydrophobic membrane anchor protein [Steroidobacteraceae bacterium]|nr:succinate dehydrogenase, hydrophobic membrane anchor protein [Steroidobacteraceae bacterium]